MRKLLRRILVIAMSLCIVGALTETMPVQAASVNMENQTFCADTYFSAFIKDDNSLWTSGGSGVLGVRELLNEDWNWMKGSGGVPVKVMDDAKSVYANGDRTCYVIKTDNSLWALGKNDGAFGDGTLQPSKTPVKIMDDVVCITCGKYGWFEKGTAGQSSRTYSGCIALALKSDGTLWGWGTNHWGEIGDGTFEPRLAPVKIMDNVSCAVSGISLTRIQNAGDSVASSYAIKTDGTLWAWGNNDMGQLGNGTMNSQTSPVKITDNVREIEAIDGTCSVVKNDESYWSWGWEPVYKVGAAIYHRPVPNPTKKADSVLSAVASESDKYFIKNDASLWAWGYAPNLDLLRNGQQLDYTEPVGIMDHVQKIYKGRFSTFAIREDYVLWGWGINSNGEIGVGAITGNFQQSPIPVMEQVLAVYPTNFSTYILRTDGTLWGCGNDKYCQFGQGKHEAKRETPVLITDHVRMY